jgi:hypothetical protein
MVAAAITNHLPGGAVVFLKHCRGTDLRTRIDEHGMPGAKAGDRRHDFAHSAHLAGMRPEADRNVGTDTGGDRMQQIGAAIQRGKRNEAAERGRGIGRSAAEARGERNVFFERDPNRKQRTAMSPEQRLGSPGDQVVVAQRCLPRKRAGEHELEVLGLLETQPIRHIGKSDDRVEEVITIGAAAHHRELEIDFCAGELADCGGHQPLIWLVLTSTGVTGVSSARPLFSFFSIRSRSATSGLLSLACCHWKRASS